MDFCTLASGSSGNCTYAGTERTAVLVDAGISCKRITEGLRQIDRSPEEISGILVTHEHTDHVCGLAVLVKKYGIPVYGTPGTLEAVWRSGKFDRVDPGLFHFVHPDERFSVGDLTVEPFRTFHDAAQPVGYRLEGGNSRMAVATDMGSYDDYVVEHLKGLDGILLEANHDINMLEVGPYPWPLKQRILGERGHLSNIHAGQLLCRILHDDLKTIVLGHLSKENNYEALAYATVTSEITIEDNPYKAEDFYIEVAKRDQVSDMHRI